MVEMEKLLNDKLKGVNIEQMGDMGILVDPEEGVSVDELASILQKNGAKDIVKYPMIGTVAAKMKPSHIMGLKDTVGIKKCFDAVGKIKLHLDEGKPMILEGEYGKIPVLPDGYKVEGDGIKVAIIDSGIDLNHPDFEGRIAKTIDFTGEGIEDYNGHGTHVAGIIGGAGKGSDGKYMGVAPKVRFYIAKVFDVNGSCTRQYILDAIQWCVEQGADVINMSLGGHATPRDGSCQLCRMVDWATKEGVTVVISAGNEGEYGKNSTSCPANARTGLAVGAVNKDRSICDFSSRGPTSDSRDKPDIVAPGGNIISCASSFVDRGSLDAVYEAMSGTSMSAPHVSGFTALLMEAYKRVSEKTDYHNDLGPEELKSVVKSGAKSLGYEVNTEGSGLVNFEACLRWMVDADMIPKATFEDVYDKRYKKIPISSLKYTPTLSGRLEPLMSNDINSFVLGMEKGKLKEEPRFMHLGAFSENHEEHGGRRLMLNGGYPHVITVFGQRGTGKSYTLGVLIEELATLEHKPGVVVIDPVGIFYEMKKDNKSQKERALLNEWGFEPKGVENVNILVPESHSKILSGKDGIYSIKISDLTDEDWHLIFGYSDKYTPQMGAIKKTIELVKKGYIASYEGKEIRVPPVADYSFGDLIQCLEFSTDLQNSDEVSKQTRFAVMRRFRDISTWGIFSVHGVPLEDISKSGNVTVIDVSLFDSALIRGVVVGVLARNIYNSRKRKEGKIPPTWLIVDEAHILVPSQGDTVASEPLIRYAKEGRAPGCAMIVATQEPSAVNSSLLKQSNLVITHSLSNNDDINSYLKNAPAKMPTGQSMDDLIRRLPIGTCLVSDRFTQFRSMVVQIRPRKSNHGGKERMIN